MQNNRNKPQLDAKYFQNKSVTENEVYEFKRAFDIIDQDNSGRITISEMNAAFIALGLQDEAKTLGDYFSSSDRTITFDDFFTLLTKDDIDPLTDVTLGNYFKLLDSGNKGVLSATDLLEISKHFGDNFDAQQIQDMIAVLSKDGQAITPEDFAQVMLEGEELQKKKNAQAARISSRY